MAEYIDKQAAIADGYQFAVNRLRVFQTAEVEPVRHGEWTNKKRPH